MNGSKLNGSNIFIRSHNKKKRLAEKHEWTISFMHIKQVTDIENITPVSNYLLTFGTKMEQP